MGRKPFPSSTPTTTGRILPCVFGQSTLPVAESYSKVLKRQGKKPPGKAGWYFCNGTVLCGVPASAQERKHASYSLIWYCVRYSLRDKEHSFSLPWVLVRRVVFVMKLIPFRGVNTETALNHVCSMWRMGVPAWFRLCEGAGDRLGLLEAHTAVCHLIQRETHGASTESIVWCSRHPFMPKYPLSG